ncbi:MAG: SDR family oxidoreductase [Verrucomicrobiota bacterium]
MSGSPYEKLAGEVSASPRTWLVTGAGGFIGSNLLEALLKLGQRVVGLDNFSTGHQRNLLEVERRVGAKNWKRFRFIEGDIRNLPDCKCACHEVEFVLHQAALGSVPKSMIDPLSSHDSNVTGFLNMLSAARDAKVKRFVYASSSSIYGDDPNDAKVEEVTGHLLSPYAGTKKINEIYADVFSRAYGLGSIGLRYFNVFGPRQDPEGAYAAVIPQWISSLLKREPVIINGDGETSRDFCFVENVVEANLLASTTLNPEAINQVYNIALGQRTSLNELLALLQAGLCRRVASLPEQKAGYRDFREGDVRHSLADIAKAKRLLHYAPRFPVREGLELAMDWYVQNLS